MNDSQTEFRTGSNVCDVKLLWYSNLIQFAQTAKKIKLTKKKFALYRVVYENNEIISVLTIKCTLNIIYTK